MTGEIDRDEALFLEARKLFDRKPIDEVMPVLITAVARALVIEADGDTVKISLLVAKFYAILTDQITSMLDEGEGETLQ